MARDLDDPNGLLEGKANNSEVFGLRDAESLNSNEIGTLIMQAMSSQ